MSDSSSISRAAPISDRRPVIAAGASLLWPGLGHVYLGRALRGLLFFFVGGFGLWLLLIARELDEFGPIAALAGMLLFAAPAWDAYRCCKKLLEERAG